MTCDVCDGVLSEDRVSGDLVCLRCARSEAELRAMRDGLERARSMLRGRHGS